MRTYTHLLFCLCVNMLSGTQKLYGETKGSHYPKFLYVNMKPGLCAVSVGVFQRSCKLDSFPSLYWTVLVMSAGVTKSCLHHSVNLLLSVNQRPGVMGWRVQASPSPPASTFSQTNSRISSSTRSA